MLDQVDFRLRPMAARASITAVGLAALLGVGDQAVVQACKSLCIDCDARHSSEIS